MSDSDKYPENSGRRRFVKGVVGSAALGGVGVSTSAMIDVTTNPTGSGGGNTEYFAIEHVDGPAPRGMPMIPIDIDSDGNIKGLFPKWSKQTNDKGQTVNVAEMDIGGITYTVDWFQYCGVQSYPGLQPDANQDEYFRYADAPPYQWQSESVNPGDKVNVDDFSDYNTWGDGIGHAGLGKPAQMTWRSQNLSGDSGIMPAQILKISDSQWKMMQQNVTGEAKTWLDAASKQQFVAWLDKCTHFCCVPGFKALEQSVKFEAEDLVYCPCHQSVYDPFNPVKKTFVALPRPGD